MGKILKTISEDLKDYSNIGSFEEAFNLALSELGVNREFIYNGEVYSTITENDRNSRWINKIPSDGIWKIDFNDGDKLYKFMGNEWTQISEEDGKLIPINFAKTSSNNGVVEKPIDTSNPNNQTTQEVVFSTIMNIDDPKYDDVKELLNQGRYDDAWNELTAINEEFELIVGDENLDQEAVFNPKINKETGEIQPHYDSNYPFYGIDQIQFAEGFIPLSQGTFTPWDNEHLSKYGQRKEGHYILVKFEDDTVDPSKAIRQSYESVSDDKIFNFLMSMPNTKDDAQRLGLGDRWDEVEKYHDEGYRLVTTTGDVEKGYAEVEIHRNLFEVEAGIIEWGFMKSFNEWFFEGEWVYDAPIVGSFNEYSRTVKIAEALQRVEDGTADGTDMMLLKDVYDKSRRDSNWGTMFANGLQEVIGFAVDLRMTRGLQTFSTKISQKAITKILTKLTSKGGKEYLDTLLVKYGTKITSRGIGIGVQSQVGFIGHQMSGIADKMLPHFEIGTDMDGELYAMITSDGMNMMDAYLYTSAENYIAIWSEQLGEHMVKISPMRFEIASRIGLTDLLKKLNPNMTNKQLKELLSRYGYQGVFIEMLEEEADRGARGVLYEADTRLFEREGNPTWEYKLPTLEEWTSTMATFIVSPVKMGITGLNYTFNYRNIQIARDVANRELTDTSKERGKKFQGRDSVKAVNKAYEDGLISENTRNYMYIILDSPGNETFDENGILEIFDTEKKITKDKYVEDIMKTTGMSKADAEGLWFQFLTGRLDLDGEYRGYDVKNILEVSILGRTRIDMDEGAKKVLVHLFTGANESTIIEEFLGYQYRTMNNEEWVAFNEAYEEYVASGGRLRPEELFEKKGVDYIMGNADFVQHPFLQIWDAVKQDFGSFINEIKGKSGMNLPDNVTSMYENMFVVDKAESLDEPIVRNINTNIDINEVSDLDGDSYQIKVVPTKKVGIKLANKSIINPANQDKPTYEKKVVNRGILQGFRNILDAVNKGNINIEGARQWYNEETQGAFDVLKQEIPELKDDPALEVFAKVVLAITSNGQNVRVNWNQAVELVKDYLRDGSFTIGSKLVVADKDKTIRPMRGDSFKVLKGEEYVDEAIVTRNIEGKEISTGGIRSKNVGGTLLLIQDLIQKKGMSGAMRFLLEKNNGRVIGDEMGFNNITKEGDHFGAERIGEKIGAFFLNLNGISDLPTFDLWWSRTWNRWMGTPLNKQGTELQDSPRNKAERRLMTNVLFSLSDRLSSVFGVDINPQDVQALLWYYEKDLYIRSGATPSDLVSFKDVAIERQETINEKERQLIESTSPEGISKSLQDERDGDIRTSEQEYSDRDIEARDKKARESVRKGDSFQIKAFHGTNNPFIDLFNPDAVKSHQKIGDVQGWGTYFAEDKLLAKWYAKLRADNVHPQDKEEVDGKPTVYEVIVHKGKKPNQYDYLQWEDTPSQKQTEKILQAFLNDFSAEEMQHVVDLYRTLQTGESIKVPSFHWNPKTNEINQFNVRATWIGQDIYDLVASIYAKRNFLQVEEKNAQSVIGDARKEASMFFLEAGIDGINFIAGMSPKGVKGMSKGIVVFDANEIDIQNRESYQLKVTKQKLDYSAESTYQYFYQGIVDKFARILNIQDTLRHLPKDLNVYLELVAFPGKSKYLVEQINVVAEKIFKAVERSGFKVSELEDFLYAKHVKERNATIRERTGGKDNEGSGMSDEWADEILDKYTGTQIEKIAERFQKQIVRKNLQALKSAGLITEEEFIELNERWKHYIPLKNRKGIKGIQDRMRMGQGFSIVGNEYRRAGGRKGVRADNVILHAIADYQNTIVRIEKNKIMKKLGRLVEKNPSDLWSVRKVKYKLVKPIWDDDGNYEHPEMDLKDNEVGFRDIVDGKVVQYVIEINDFSDSIFKFEKGRNPLLSSIKNIGVSKSIPVLNKLNGWLRTVYTTWNPDFIISNFERDIQTAFYNLNIDYDPKMTARIMLDVRKALAGVYKSERGYEKVTEWMKIYKDYKKNGGQMGWFDLDGIEEKLRKLEKDIRIYTEKGQTRRKIQAIGKWIEDVNQAIETGVRLSTYNTMLNNGMSKKEAIQVAKDLTINFNRKGEWGSMINSLYLFFNAGVQGAVNVGKRAMTPGGGAVAGTLFAMGFINSWWNKQMCPDGYNHQISDYKKDNYLIFMKPDCTVGFTLRMPYGWGVFKAVGSIAEDYGAGDSSLGESTARIFASFTNSFNPFGGANLSQMVTPTFLDPIFQLYTDTDFKNDNIYPKSWGYEHVPRYSLYKKNTSPTYIKMAKFLNDISGGRGQTEGLIRVAPVELEHFANFFGGGALNFLDDALVTGKSLITDRKLPTLRNSDKTNWGKVPFAGHHITTANPYVSKGKIYDYLNTADTEMYNEREHEEFVNLLQIAIENGVLGIDEAFGKNPEDIDGDLMPDVGDGGMYKKFRDKQRQVFRSIKYDTNKFEYEPE